MGGDIPQEHFKPYVPNASTKLGRAYLLAVKDCDGLLLATEANFLRDNPILWLRGVSLYAANLDFLIRQSKMRLKTLIPEPGEPQSAAYLREVRENKKWSIVQEHRLQKIRARRAELTVETGYRDIREVMVAGDVIGAFVDILAALKQEDWSEGKRLAEYWITRLSGLDAGEDPDDGSEVTLEPVPKSTIAPVDQDAVESLLRKIRGE